MTSSKYHLQNKNISSSCWLSWTNQKTMLFQLPPDFNSPDYFGSYSRDTRRQSQRSTMELIHYTSIASHIKWSGTKGNPKNKRDSIIPTVVFSPYSIKEMIRFWSVHVRVQPQKGTILKNKTPNKSTSQNTRDTELPHDNNGGHHSSTKL